MISLKKTNGQGLRAEDSDTRPLSEDASSLIKQRAVQESRALLELPNISSSVLAVKMAVFKTAKRGFESHLLLHYRGWEVRYLTGLIIPQKSVRLGYPLPYFNNSFDALLGRIRF